MSTIPTSMVHPDKLSSSPPITPPSLDSVTQTATASPSPSLDDTPPQADIITASLVNCSSASTPSDDVRSPSSAERQSARPSAVNRASIASSARQGKAGVKGATATTIRPASRPSTLAIASPVKASFTRPTVPARSHPRPNGTFSTRALPPKPQISNQRTLPQQAFKPVDPAKVSPKDANPSTPPERPTSSTASRTSSTASTVRPPPPVQTPARRTGKPLSSSVSATRAPLSAAASVSAARRTSVVPTPSAMATTTRKNGVVPGTPRSAVNTSAAAGGRRLSVMSTGTATKERVRGSSLQGDSQDARVIALQAALGEKQERIDELEARLTAMSVPQQQSTIASIEPDELVEAAGARPTDVKDNNQVECSLATDLAAARAEVEEAKANAEKYKQEVDALKGEADNRAATMTQLEEKAVLADRQSAEMLRASRELQQTLGILEANAVATSELESTNRKLQNLVDHNQQVVEALGEGHAKALLDLSITHHERVTRLEKDIEDRTASQKAALEELNSTHHEIIEGLKAEHADTLARREKDEQDRMLQCIDAASETHIKRLNELKANHSASIERLKAEHADVLSTVREISQIAEDERIQRAIEGAQAESLQEIAELQAQLSYITKELMQKELALQKERDTAQDARNALQEEHQQSTKDLVASHDERISEMQRTRNEKIAEALEAATAAHELEVKNLKAAHDSELELAKQAQISAMAAIQVEMDEKLQKALDNAKAESLQEIGDLHAQLSTITRQLLEKETAWQSNEEDAKIALEAQRQQHQAALLEQAASTATQHVNAIEQARKEAEEALQAELEAFKTSSAVAFEELKMTHASDLHRATENHATALSAATASLVQDLADARSDHKQAYERLQGEIETHKEQLHAAQESASAAQEALAAANSALAASSSSNTDKGDIDAVRAELEAATTEVQTMKGKLAAADQMAKDELDMISELHERELAESGETLAALEKQLTAEFEAARQSAQQDLTRANEEIQRLQEEMNSTRQNTNGAQQVVNDSVVPLQNQLKEVETRLGVSEAEKAKLHAQVDETLQHLEALHAASNKKFAELEVQYRREVESLQEINLKLQMDLANKS